VSGNSAGVVLNEYARAGVVISQSTIVGNYGPGLLRSSYYGHYYGSFDVSGSIVANNEQDNCWTTSGGSNLSSDPCGTAEPSDILGADPRLMPLDDNGGPTRTHALYPDSPAIDAAGDCELATDQRGVVRPQDGDGDGIALCDIGALELASVLVVIDIQPHSLAPINLGVVPVVILGSDHFHVDEIDVTRLGFGPAHAACIHDLTDDSTLRDHLEDVNLDGHMDLMTHFLVAYTNITCDDETATLSGSLMDGASFEGTDSVYLGECRTRRPPTYRGAMRQRQEERSQPIQEQRVD
jgi:hypothetical protein